MRKKRTGGFRSMIQQDALLFYVESYQACFPRRTQKKVIYGARERNTVVGMTAASDGDYKAKMTRTETYGWPERIWSRGIGAEMGTWEGKRNEGAQTHPSLIVTDTSISFPWTTESAHGSTRTQRWKQRERGRSVSSKISIRCASRMLQAEMA
jgi:hypothetical protein